MMKGLFLFRLTESQYPSPAHFCQGLLVVLLMLGVMLNTMLDTDCFQVQKTTCSCKLDSPDQDAEIQTDTCTHCTGWLPVFICASQSAVSFTDSPFDNPADPVPGILHLERPPIFA